jgi:hypothetical protein
MAELAAGLVLAVILAMFVMLDRALAQLSGFQAPSDEGQETRLNDRWN